MKIHREREKTRKKRMRQAEAARSERSSLGFALYIPFSLFLLPILRSLRFGVSSCYRCCLSEILLCVFFFRVFCVVLLQLLLILLMCFVLCGDDDDDADAMDSFFLYFVCRCSSSLVLNAPLFAFQFILSARSSTSTTVQREHSTNVYRSDFVGYTHRVIIGDLLGCVAIFFPLLLLLLCIHSFHFVRNIVWHRICLAFSNYFMAWSFDCYTTSIIFILC